MDTTDVDSNADGAQERFTNHLFNRDLEPIARPSGSAVRVPSDMSVWPPAALFDAVYAGAVVHHFGCTLTEILEKWGEMFYPGEPTKAAYRDEKRQLEQAEADKENSSGQTKARRRRFERRSTRDTINPHDAVMMYRFSAMEPEKAKAYLNGCEDMAAAGERKGLEEKVSSWRQSLAPD